jgi:hypothetical protein
MWLPRLVMHLRGEAVIWFLSAWLLIWILAAAYCWFDRDRRHQRCRWYYIRRRHCPACVWKLEQEIFK